MGQLLYSIEQMPINTLIEIGIKTIVLIGGMMTAAAYLVLLERRMAAWVQDRVGPSRVGAPLSVFGMKDLRLWGLGQPLADGVKFITKEEYDPAHVDRRLFTIAPLVVLAAALGVFAVVPVGSVVPGPGDSDPISLVVAPGMDVALFLIFALSGIAVYGVVLGGWASNNKYSLLGGLRTSAQLIAYELPLGLGILGVVLAAGSLNLERIIEAQAGSCWYAFSQPLGFFVFVVAAFAEAARLPFDLPECEQELVGGYHTEYAGIKLLLLLVAEFLHMVTGAFLIVILFLGGWHFWGLTGGADPEAIGWFHAVMRVAVLMIKTLLVILFFMLVRWSWPRFRYDQLMAFAWKVMLPLGLVSFTSITILDHAREEYQMNPFVAAGISWAICLGSLIAVTVAAPTIADNRPRVATNAEGEL